MVQLDLMILVPALLALLALGSGRFMPRMPRWVALVAIAAQAGLFVSLASAGVFSGQRAVGVNLGVGPLWSVALDGLSAPLVALTIFIGAVAVVTSWNMAERPGSYFAIILALQAALSAVFLAESIVLFYVAWECALIPMYFLIGGWGSSNRRHAATKYLLYTFAAGAVMLVGVILAMAETGGSPSMTSIAANSAQMVTPALVFWLLMAGFVVKIPLVPFHTWLPDAHTEAPTAGSIILAGVLLKMGAYGVLRLAMPFAPSAFQDARGLLAVMGVIGIVYGAAMAFVQTDLKRLVAYSSVAHMGFVVLAIAVATPAALGAAMLVMVSHGFVAGLLFLLVGSLYERTHTRELGRFGGLGRIAPWWSVAFVFGALASLGLPGLSGFPGEFAALLEAFRTFGWPTAIIAVGLVLAAAYNLRAVRETVQGPACEFTSIPDLTSRESVLVIAFATGIIWIGLQPRVVLDVAASALTILSRTVGGGA